MKLNSLNVAETRLLSLLGQKSAKTDKSDNSDDLQLKKLRDFQDQLQRLQSQPSFKYSAKQAATEIQVAGKAPR